MLRALSWEYPRDRLVHWVAAINRLIARAPEQAQVCRMSGGGAIDVHYQRQEMIT